ncbi:hypothetical protein [Floccifex sp.]|uniref:hypothetical protein n=1 Tax=Floccifex sp. TaxID=2815810 RepID=UPI003F065604
MEKIIENSSLRLFELSKEIKQICFKLVRNEENDIQRICDLFYGFSKECKVLLNFFDDEKTKEILINASLYFEQISSTLIELQKNEKEYLLSLCSLFHFANQFEKLYKNQ